MDSSLLNAAGRALAVLATLAAIGCSAAPRDVGERSDPGTAIPSGEVELSKDFGVVPAGDELRHTFEFINGKTERLFIAADGDIAKSCGCAQVVPSFREVAPGDAVQIVMTVRTVGRRDALHEAAHIFWTSASGERVRTGFSMRAVLSSGIELSENPVVLKHAELGGKVVRLESTLPVDWKTLSISVAEGPFRVFDVTTRSAGATCRVACDLASDESRADGLLFVTARGLPATKLADRTLSITAPLAATQSVRLGALPRNALVQVQPDGTGTTRIILFGTAVAEAKPVLVATIAYQGATAAWIEQRLSNDKTLLTISLPECATAADVPKQLRLALTSGDCIVVPYVLFQAAVPERSEES